MFRPTRALFALFLIGAIVTACTGSAEDPSPTAGQSSPAVSSPVMSASPSASASETAAAECTPETLETQTAGQLTIGTDNPAFPPYWQPPAEGEEPSDPMWELGDPYNKQGFESAVAWAVAEELGFGDDDVEFIAVPFNNSFAPGEKDFDFYLAQVSYLPERAEQVDMSDGYYFSNQALVANADTPITEAASIADVAEYRLGVQVGTTALAYVEDEIAPSTKPSVFDSNDAAIAALEAGQVDGIVVDLPTALFITAVQMENGVVVGQFPSADESGDEYFSLVLDLDSPLTECVNQALATLTESGELEAITEEWMEQSVEVPVLE